MKNIIYLIKNLFLRKILLCIITLLLFFVVDFIVFVVARSILSSLQGYNEFKGMESEGVFIANLDPDNEIDISKVTLNKTQNIYKFLHNNYSYAIYTDGFIVSIPNKENMEISLGYYNNEYNILNPFPVTEGEKPSFDYQIDDEVPVLVGKGLSESYPVGSKIIIDDPALQKSINLKVNGVLQENAGHSNMYALNSHYYYNFTILIPVNLDFINQANLDFLINGLMDIIVIQTTRERADRLGRFISDCIGIEMNFYSQKENFEYFTVYYIEFLKRILVVSLLLLFVLIILSVWMVMVNVKVIIRDITIHLLVGLNHHRLKEIFALYYWIIFAVSTMVILIITAFSRYDCWLRKETLLVTYGVLYLLKIEWISILLVFVFNMVIVSIIVRITLLKVKRIPISLGVLQ